MKDCPKLVKMSNTSLPRVEDLEKSAQWTSLAEEINHLEKMCRLNNHRHSKKPVLKFHNYQKHSVPQVQKALSVWIEPSTEMTEGLARNSELSKPDVGETYPWSWRPKTEFERTYFFDDYSQCKFQDDSPKRYGSFPYNESFSQNTESQRSTQHRKDQSPLLRTDQSRRPFDVDKFSQVYNRINEHYGSESSYSGTRERLHEIFERNRYLRRKFFSSMPGNDAASYATEFPKGFDDKNPGAVSKYTNNGFGSTETLTSQSNQSSISSINDRKSRGVLNVTPELVEEGSCVGESPRKSECLKNTSHVTSTPKGSKLLVKIVPGNEVYVSKEPTSFHDGTSVRKSALDDTVVAGEGFQRSQGNEINMDNVRQYSASNPYTPTRCTMCCEQLKSKEEVKHQGRECESSLNNEPINEVYSVNQAANQQMNSSKYVVGSPNSWHESDGNNKKTVAHSFVPESPTEKLLVQNIQTDEEGARPQDSKYLHQFLSGYGSEENVSGSKLAIQTDLSYVTSIKKDEVPIGSECASWTKQNMWCSQQNHCKSLPDLTLSERLLNSPLQTNHFINEADLPSKSSVHSNIKPAILSYYTSSYDNQNIAENRKHFASQIDLSNPSDQEPTSLALRRVKIAKIPPPLDLSRVNEKYEEAEALERRQLCNYTVDVSLLRNYDCPLKGQPAVVKDECFSDDNQDLSKFRESSPREAVSLIRRQWHEENASERSCRGKSNFAKQKQLRKESVTRALHKSCGDLTAMDDLRSPQLVNNYKNSMIDLRTSNSVVNLLQSSQAAELGAARNRNDAPPLSDRVNSIGALQAGTGTTLPSVYGPIPYSQ